MKTHRRPGFDAGIRPRLALQRTSSGCIFKKPAASASVSVFIGCLALQSWGTATTKKGCRARPCDVRAAQQLR